MLFSELARRCTPIASDSWCGITAFVASFGAMNYTILNFRFENQLFEIKNLTYFYILTQSIACASLPHARFQQTIASLAYLGVIWDRTQSAIDRVSRQAGDRTLHNYRHSNCTAITFCCTGSSIKNSVPFPSSETHFKRPRCFSVTIW